MSRRDLAFLALLTAAFVLHGLLGAYRRPMTVSDAWWMVILFSGPGLGFTLGGRFRELGTRRRLAIAACALAAFVVAFTPASLPGESADPLAMGFAYVALCLSAGAVLTPMPRWVVFGTVGFLSMVFGPWLLRDDPRSRNVPLGCGYRVRLEGYGWAVNSGTLAVVLWRPAWSPLEFERAREWFSDITYAPAGLSVVSGGRCEPVVTYDGEAVWRYAPRATPTPPLRHSNSGS